MNGKSHGTAQGNDAETEGTPRQSVDTLATSGTGGTTDTNASTMSMDSTSTKDTNKQNRRTEERKQRGLMQWKPARNMKFAKDEGKLGIRKLKNRLTGGLDGRQPGVETETGQ